jgi:Cu(I)/Ag(I) efflux system membrane fusion protein
MHKNVIIMLALLVLVVAAIGIFPALRDQSSTEPVEVTFGTTYYTCPMHPSVRSDRPGACPVCGMSLVKKVEASRESTHEPSDLTTVTISPSRQILANVSTAVARRMGLERTIDAAGRIEYAEPNYLRISTRFPGRIERLHLNYTGQQVKPGDPVADVYSPEAVSAQQEYLLALEAVEQTRDGYAGAAETAETMLDQSRQKLLLWGFSEAQLDELTRTHKPQTVVTIHSPIGGTVLKRNVERQQYVAAGEALYEVADLSTVWLYLDVYEYELQNVRMGQKVEARVEAYPGETFLGTIRLISPTVESSSRTVWARTEFPNPSMKLKIGMFVQASIKVPVAPAIVVPTSSIQSSGRRNVVWVQKEPTVFEPRAVTFGARTADYTQILSGIEEGDVVVSSGGYLLDSESQLETTTRHQHDGPL